MSATETPTGDSPFRGLGHYAEADAGWFFGRESERKTIIGNLRAARLTLLYAESGVGKSSLLRAGVASRLREIARRNAERGSPKFIPVVFSSWKDDPVEELIGEIEREANSFDGKGHTISLPRERLATAIKAASDAVDATFLIILDQFEEYFGYRLARRNPERLAGELAKSMADPQVRANFLIAIREDAYARLGDLFVGHKINVYGNYLHLEYLDRAAARTAIERPIERFNATHITDEPIKLEPALTDAVLDEVRRGRLVLGQGVLDGAAGAGRSADLSDEIETPFLQLVMTRLWDVEYGRGSSVLRKATLHDLGGAETVVRTHLDGALAGLAEEELETATDILHDLVTPSGAKIAHTAGDLEKMTARSKDTVVAVLEKLDTARVVRSVEPAPGTGEERYEIFHDRLAAPLLDWIAVRDNERLRHEARAEHRRANTFRALAIGSALLLILAVLAVVFAEIQSATANRNRKTAQSFRLAASSQATVNTDTELSALLALQGLRISETDQAVSALRNALLQLRELATLSVGATVEDAAFSPDGKEMVTASDDGKARIWSAGTHRLLGELSQAQRSTLYSAAFSPDGKEIVTASDDGKARIWSAGTRRLLGVLTEPPHSVDNVINNAAFSPDGKEIVTASSDGTARIWSTNGYRLLGVLTEPPSADNHINSAAFSPDGTKIVTASDDGTALVWSASSYRLLGVLAEPATPDKGINSAAFSPDGKEIVTASDDGTARIWSASSYQQVSTLAGHSGAVETAAFSPDGMTVVTAGVDGTAKLWNTATPAEQLRVLTEPASGDNLINYAAFSPDGKEIVTASNDGTARIWSASTRRLLGVLTEPPSGDNWINGAAFSPDGTKIVTASLDGTARIWSAGTRRLLGVLTEPPSVYNQMNNARFSPDGKEIVTASNDGTARIWSAGTQRLLGVLTEPPSRDNSPSRDNWINDARFSRDGKEIVTASDDGTARIWSASTRRLLGLLNEHSPLKSAAFSPDGTEIVTAGFDGSARIWSASSHAALTTTTEPDYVPLNSAEFSPDGKEIVTASDDGTARIWSTELAGPAQAIERIAQMRVTRQLTPAERNTYLAGI